MGGGGEEGKKEAQKIVIGSGTGCGRHSRRGKCEGLTGHNWGKGWCTDQGGQRDKSGCSIEDGIQSWFRKLWSAGGGPQGTSPRMLMFDVPSRWADGHLIQELHRKSIGEFCTLDQFVARVTVLRRLDNSEEGRGSYRDPWHILYQLKPHSDS